MVTDEAALELGENDNLEIGIVKTTYVETHRNYTEIVLESADLEPSEVKVKNNAGFLLGKLCVMDRQKEIIWPFYEPDYLFWLYDAKKYGYRELLPRVPPPVKPKPKQKQKQKQIKNREKVKCSICGCELRKNRLKKHMRKVHPENSA